MTEPAVEPAPLSAKDRKAARERARRAAIAKVEREEQERIEGELRATRAAPEAEANKPEAGIATTAPVAELETDAQLSANAGHFLKGVVFPVLAFLARWSPWTLDAPRLTSAQAAEDGEAWLPVLRRYQLARTVVRYGAGVARLIARVQELSGRRSAA